jgi:diadenosine tetraphosphatase ApaH/serine/threonine PP2A family protein phosphatase
MRIAVFSDINANLDALLAVLQDTRSQGCTRLFCCGDVVGYGGNPNECCKILRERNIPTVIGNHDQVVATDLPLEFGAFNPMAAASVYWTREYTTVSNREWLGKLPFKLVEAELGITFCHASPLSPGDWTYLTSPISAAPTLNYMETPICFIGHSHEPAVFWMEPGGHIMMVPPCTVRLRPKERYLINAGSVGQPRDNDTRASYFIYDHTDRVIFPRRVPYPVHVAQQKIRNAGLPERLAERLALGK